ncbi:MBL fold metallo-hydrolase [Sulfuriroseicoccus oceanibius]|nr:MBL fold metallo-hydrolase [Sulfuriroseicoccus oceanibius]
MKITFLGTGTSVGVPVISCHCEVCTSNDPRDTRLRSSIHVEAQDGTCWIVDCGPDLRTQCLRAGIEHLDAVLISHAHTDHVMGFDDLRPFSWRKDDGLPIYATHDSLVTLRQSFGFAFDNAIRQKGYFHPNPMCLTGPFHLGTTRVTPLPVIHGNVDTIGYLFETEAGKRIAYMSDVKTVPAESREQLGSLDLLVIDALRPAPHPTHMCIDEALAFSERIGSPRTLLTHLTHDIRFRDLEPSLPNHVEIAYDMLEVVI